MCDICAEVRNLELGPLSLIEPMGTVDALNFVQSKIVNMSINCNDLAFCYVIEFINQMF